MQLKAGDLDNIYAGSGDGTGLNDKLILTLSKYIFEAFKLIQNRDTSKSHIYTNHIFFLFFIELI